jgi:hypothetical protein
VNPIDGAENGGSTEPDPLQAIYEYLADEAVPAADDPTGASAVSRLVVPVDGYEHEGPLTADSSEAGRFQFIWETLRGADTGDRVRPDSDPLLGIVLALGDPDQLDELGSLIVASIDRLSGYSIPPVSLLGVQFDGHLLVQTCEALVGILAELRADPSAAPEAFSPTESYYFAWSLFLAVAVTSLAASTEDSDWSEASLGGEAVAVELERVFLRAATRLGNGTYRLRLSENGRSAVSERLQLVRDELLGSGTPDGVRLRPPAFGTDSNRNADWARLAGDQLLAHRLDALDLAEAALHRRILSEADLTALVQTINSIRLLLGTRLDRLGRLDVEGPPVHRRKAGALDDEVDVAAMDYEFLGHLLGNLVEALDEE